VKQARLVLFEQEQISPTGGEPLRTQVALAEEGIAREHPAGPGAARQQRGGHRPRGLAFGGPRRAGLRRQHNPVRRAEGGQGMHRAAPVLEGQAASLRLAVPGHALPGVALRDRDD
jgi:hypothetical protein